MRASLHGVAITAPLAASVSNQVRPPSTGQLNNSGPGRFAWLLIVSGAVAGMLTVRRFVKKA